MRWTFRRMSRGEVNRETMEWEFFEDEDRVTRLVRESIQNSLDATGAGANGVPGTTRVRFSLTGIDRPLPAHRAESYLDGLGAHVAAVQDLEIADLNSLVAESKGMPYIVIEDQGTVGLEGDHLQYDDSQATEGNHFYWFFRNVGRSGKGENSNGSWGLGKWVFPDSSKIGSFIAVTRRRSDDRLMLMGQSVLKIHSVNGERHDPYGYFADRDEHDMAVPTVSDDAPTVTSRFLRDFGIEWRDEKPGLSIVVPFPRVGEERGIDLDTILGAVLENYFYAIISGRLEVTLESSTEEVEVTSDTIDTMLDRAAFADGDDDSGERSAKSYRALFAMARECLRMSDDGRIRISMRELPNISSDDARAEAVRRRFHAGEIVAVRVETRISRKDQGPMPTHLDLYIQKDESLSQGHDYYVRGTLSISEMNQIRQWPARALMVIDENQPLAHLLRDSEPPAHTNWRSTAELARIRWRSSQRHISDVRGAANRILQMTTRRDDVIQRDVFTQLFPHPVPTNSGSSTGSGSSVRDKPPVYTPNPQPFRIVEVSSGFVIRADRRGGAPEPNEMRVRVAYDIPRGDALSAYSLQDFRLHHDATVMVSTTGCRVVSAANDPANELRVAVDDPAAFSIRVVGFDPNRDLYVRAVSEPEDSE